MPWVITKAVDTALCFAFINKATFPPLLIVKKVVFFCDIQVLLVPIFSLFYKQFENKHQKQEDVVMSFSLSAPAKWPDCQL